MKPTIAIIGRPNVGKSTLFNRLVGKRLALVDDQPGVTRDRREGEGTLFDLEFRVFDTAGYEDEDPQTLPGRMRAQTEAALQEADVALFLVDGRAGITPLDEEIGRWLRGAGCPVVLADGAPLAGNCRRSGRCFCAGRRRRSSRRTHPRHPAADHPSGPADRPTEDGDHPGRHAGTGAARALDVINAASVQRIEGYITDAAQRGATVRVDGRGAGAGSSFVIRANGSVVAGRQNSSWFGNESGLAGVKAEAGDTIFVPEELDKTTFVQHAKDWTQILAQFALGVAALNSINP